MLGLIIRELTGWLLEIRLLRLIGTKRSLVLGGEKTETEGNKDRTMSATAGN